jgi:hypothetical protein
MAKTDTDKLVEAVLVIKENLLKMHPELTEPLNAALPIGNGNPSKETVQLLSPDKGGLAGKRCS